MVRNILVGKEVRFNITVRIKKSVDNRFKNPKVHNGGVIRRRTSGKIQSINGEYCVIKCKDGSLHNRPISKLKSAFGEPLKYNNLLKAKEN